MLSPTDLDAVAARCHRSTLIRRVGADEARAAVTSGLAPFDPDPRVPDDAFAPSYLGPRPGCVYLGRPGATVVSDRPWAVVVDMTALDPAAFVVDEDAYFREILWASSDPYEPRLPPDGELPPSVVSRIGCNASLDNGRPSAGAWINTIADELDTSVQVRRCFEETDRIAYAGAIPASAIVTTFEVARDREPGAALPY